MVATCSITGGQVAEQLSQEAVETALGQAFSDAPVERPAKESARPPEADEPEAPVEAADEGEPADEVEDVEGDEPADEVAEVVAAEPEFEIEVDGAVEVVRGKDAIKELLQKGRDYSRKSEANARIRDALAAQAMQTKMAQEFQGAVFEDVAQLRAIDQQIQQYAQIDWATAFDSDPFNALKLKEQRDQLREQRAAKVQELDSKRAQFQQGQAQAAQQRIAAEQSALLVKLPEWRNNETRAKEQQSIAQSLMSQGFNEAEVAQLSDHRMLLIARKAHLYDQLQANKAQKVQQVRAAPPVVKPGAQPDKAKAESKDFLKEIRRTGRQNNRHAQEALLEKALSRVFK